MKSAWLIALLLIPPPADASPPSRTRREAVLFHAAANRAFRAGNYEEALEQLEAGYDTEPRPEFLIAFAQTYRELGRYDDAIANCERYLALAPRGPLVEQVKHLARELRRDARSREEPPPEIDASKLQEPVKPAPRPEPVVPKASPAPTLLVVAPGTSESAVAARLRRRDLTLGLVVSAAGVIIGLGVGLGVGLGASSAVPPTRFGPVSFQ